MKSYIKIVLGLVGVGVLVWAYLAVTSSTEETQAENFTGSTLAGIESAAWGEGVTITLGEDTFRYESNGLPNHELAEQYLIPNDIASQPFSDNDDSEFTTVYSAEYFTESPIDTEITLFPKYTDSVTYTSLGMIGVTISGAALFNDYENMELTLVALDDNVIHDHAAFVDDCNGHSLQNGDSYHYHGVPTCITDVVDVAGNHSTMIGVLEDGFPVYGNKGSDGLVMTNTDLDECSGHFENTPEFPAGIYHYHLTADEAPYSVDCYHGEVEVSVGASGPGDGQGAAGTGPDLAAAATTLGVTEAELRAALGTSMPPDFVAAAVALGVSMAQLQAAVPAPSGQ